MSLISGTTDILKEIKIKQKDVDPTVGFLAAKLKRGGFLGKLSEKMGIEVTEISPFVDYTRETNETKEGVLENKIEDYKQKYL